MRVSISRRVLKCSGSRYLPALIAVLFLFAVSAFADKPSNRTQSFDSAWKFYKGDLPGAEQPAFDDRAWRTVDVPHDWSIEGPFSETNLTGGAGGFLPAGVGLYRKNFTLSEMDSNRCFFVEFDGVMANSEVWINGHSLGKRPYGYVGFGYELTGHLHFGNDRTNVLAVRADTSAQPASRWYTGAGIYRHVRLVCVNTVHLTENGVFVTTSPVTTLTMRPGKPTPKAAVQIEASVTNESGSRHEITLQTTLIAPDGKPVAINETKTSSSGGPIIQQIILTNPELWNLNNPKLYRAVCQIRDGEKILDAQTASFGIRDARFDADTGFWLNGKNFKIKGVCLHHDGGAFGAAVPLDVWKQRLATLKSLGVNAIRTAHNPPAPEFLDLCDRMGFLVMDEFFDCWTVAKNSYDYHLYFNEWSKTDERDSIWRDRNHPCVILYSIGNEIHDTRDAEPAKDILRGLVQVAHEADPTRPVTQGLFRPNVTGDYTNGLADLLDIVGQNYRENEILAAHVQNPARKILGTENTHDRRQWVALRDNPPYAGQFLWTGIDYLGEARRWPLIGHGSGLLDRTGGVRPIAFERQSWWSDRPMVHVTRRLAPTDAMPTDPGYGAEERHTQVLFSDWTPKNPLPHDENVEVYSNCKEVELFLNGKSLGSKPLPADASPHIWTVSFVPGTLKAVARNDGKVAATDELRTAGAPVKIELSAGETFRRGEFHEPLTNERSENFGAHGTRPSDIDSLSGQSQQRVPAGQIRLAADWDDVACVRATVVDAHGVPVPSADNLITFKITGPGAVAAVDNGDNASHEPFQAAERHAFQGRCVAFIKATAPSGKIVLTASAPGLKTGQATLKAVPPVFAP